MSLGHVTAAQARSCRCYFYHAGLHPLPHRHVADAPALRLLQASSALWNLKVCLLGNGVLRFLTLVEVQMTVGGVERALPSAQRGLAVREEAAIGRRDPSRLGRNEAAAR